MLKDLFKKIFSELATELEDPMMMPTEDEYQKVSSADYKIEVREIGAKVEIANMDGELQNAPDGAYEFEDGFKFRVQDGLITEMEDTSQDVEEEMQEGCGECASELLEMLKKYPWDQCVADMEKQGYDMETANKICGSIKWQNQGSDKKEKEMYNNLKQEIEELKSQIINKEDLVKEIESVKEEFKTIFEKFAKVPAEPSKVTKNNLVKDDNRKKFEEFLNSIRSKA